MTKTGLRRSQLVPSPSSCDTGARGVTLRAFRQRSLHDLPRRLRTALGPLAGLRVPRSQRVYRVTLGDLRCKRVVFADSHHAASVAARLQVFAHEAVYPRLLLERERELWVEYIEGERVQRVDDALLAELARLLGVLMKRAPRRVPLRETAWLANLEVDLEFLAGVGLLERGAAQRLAATARERAPSHVWVGYDCSDAILKNFVWQRGGGLRAVDLESLGADQLLGTSAAKAALRWLGPRREEFLSQLKAVGAPDFESYFDFVELCFRAFWQKSSYLERKRRFLDPRLFEPFLAVP